MKLGWLFALPRMTVLCLLVHTGHGYAQTFTTLHHFDGAGGSDPTAGLIISGNTLYGTTISGGSGSGTVFKINTNGSGFTNLYSFSPSVFNSSLSKFTNSDGRGPWAGLVVSGNTLFGVAESGGSFGLGTIFSIQTDGTGFTNLHSFSGSDGHDPWGGLTLSSSTLFGATWRGGNSGYGVIYAINTDGTGFTNLYHFNGSDGRYPNELLLLDEKLFGTTSGGGAFGNGTIFAINTNGSDFTNLHSFSPLQVGNTNSEGAYPYAGLIASGSRLFGTTGQGGTSGKGVVFAIDTNGSGFTNLHSFSSFDGEYPYSKLATAEDTLFGSTVEGGAADSGTIFALKSDGTGFTNLYQFTAITTNTNSDGIYPYAGLVISGDVAWGVAANGGNFGNGTVFSLSLPPNLPPQLAAFLSGENIILTWPSNTIATLQSAPTPMAVFTNIPGATSPYTNSVSEPQMFFRLSL